MKEIYFIKDMTIEDPTKTNGDEILIFESMYSREEGYQIIDEDDTTYYINMPDNPSNIKGKYGIDKSLVNQMFFITDEIQPER